jgi:hypothetical protein
MEPMFDEHRVQGTRDRKRAEQVAQRRGGMRQCKAAAAAGLLANEVGRVVASNRLLGVDERLRRTPSERQRWQSGECGMAVGGRASGRS